MRIIILMIFFSAISVQTSFSQDCPDYFLTERGKEIMRNNKIMKCKVYKYYSEQFFFWVKSDFYDEFVFDSTGTITEVNSYMYDTLWMSHVYKYNSENQMIESYRLQNGFKSMRDTMIYKEGKLIEKHNSSGWHHINKYDAFGNISESHHYNDKKDSKKNTNKYNTQGDRFYKYNNSYNSKDRLIKVILTENGEYIYTKEYDTLGRLISHTQHEYTRKYEYNEKNQIINRSEKYDNSGNLVSDWGERYEYDENNKLTKMVLRQFFHIWYFHLRDEAYRRKFIFEYETY